ncbi:MAG: hypothetical protein J6Z38_06905 [Lachnospiraceae bacterium]|nr:hypothetical protein [Lachnospiraceae bacterium]
MRGFQVIGIEMHSRSMWYHAQVKKALDFMAENGFNTLIFHQSDIVNKLAFPSQYLSSRILWEKFTTFRAFDIENYSDYLNNVIFEAGKRGISVYLNLKEIFYPDEIIELHPELIGPDGIVCPTDPFWPVFIRHAMTELLENVPDIAGVILSAGTHESRTSITHKLACTCERCRNTDAEAWYRSVFEAVRGPLYEKHKKLVIRDFSFRAENQDVLLRAAKSLGDDVVISLKNTPHDFYPPFPDNPKLGTTGREEWAEFDSWGQFFGSGIFPASVAEDYAKRLRHCKEKGVSGVFFRVDWEGMFENSTFSSANKLNLYAAGLLANDADADLDTAYRKWAKEGWIETLKTDSENPEAHPYKDPEAAWPVMKEFMQRSWKILEKTVYVRGHCFCEDNMFPDSLDKAYKMMVYIHGRDDWEPGASEKVRATPENLRAIYAEKAQAVAELAELQRIADGDVPGFDDITKADLQELLKLYRLYAGIAERSAHAVFETRRYADTKAPDAKAQGLQAAAALRDYARTVRQVLSDRTVFYPHIVFWLVNDRRMDALADDCEQYLNDRKEFTEGNYRKG